MAASREEGLDKEASAVNGQPVNVDRTVPA